MIGIFIRKSIPGYDTFISSIKEDITRHIIDNNSLNGYSIQNYSRVGFVYDNTSLPNIPFGHGAFVSDGYTFQYFTKELIDLLSQASTSLTNVDLITCNMNNPKFISEVTKIKTLLPNVSINYSLNKTGNIVGSDWITESNGVSLKNIYFNGGIENYNYSLGGSLNSHSAFIANDGTVWTFGLNVYGQLGNGTTTDSNIPIATGITNAIFVSCGFFHTLVLKSDGTVWAFGYNFYGQLGIGTNTLSEPTPVQVSAINDAIYISAGGFSSAIVRSNGKVYTIGFNQYGQLGNGNNTDSNVPVEMIGVTNAIMVASSFVSTAVLKSDGTVVSSGSNDGGQLGDGTNTATNIAVNAIGITDGVFIAVGALHTIVIRSDRTLMAFGYNDDGQLGTGDFNSTNVPVPVPGLTDVYSVSCGGYTTIVLKTDGTVFTFGDNTSGQLGDGTNNSSSIPLQVSDITNAISVSGGGGSIDNVVGFMLILRSDGTIVGVGGNTNGQLGDGTNDSTLTFVNVFLNEGQTVSRLFDALIGGILCVREGSIVNTSRGKVPIEDVVSGDVVYRENGQKVSVVYNIKMLRKTNKFIKISKNALYYDSPNKDLFIVRNHPILFKGIEWFPEQLLKHVSGASEVITDDFYDIYCLCTKDRVFVNIDNAYVCTRSEKSWNELTKKKILLWQKQ
jgi:hypothetical protein